MKKLLLLFLLIANVALGQDYFYHYGYTVTGTLSSADRTAYEEGEDITFTPVATYQNVTWYFRNTKTKDTIRTVTGTPVTTSFTYAQGYEGIDVIMTPDDGCLTGETKSERILIVKNVSFPTYTVDFSTGVSDLLIDDLGSNQWALNLNTCNCGDVVRLKGNGSTLRMQTINAPNCTRANPLTIAITSTTSLTKTGTTYDELFQFRDGKPTNGITLYSRQDNSGVSYFQMNGGGIAVTRANQVNSFNDMSFIGLTINNAQATAIKFKVDGLNRFTGGCSRLRVSDCNLNASTFENTYIGNEGATANRFDAGVNGLTNDYHHLVLDAHLWANYTHDAGFDGMQMSCASGGARIHDNKFENNGKSGTFAQNFALTCGGGFTGQIFNNDFDRFCQIFGSGNTWIYNNRFRGSVTGTVNNALFIKRFNNPGYTGPNGDSYYYSDPAGNLIVFNNAFDGIQDNIYILDSQDDSFAKSPFANIYLLNNAFVWFGTAQESSGFRYAESGGSPNIQINTYIDTDTANWKLYSDKKMRLEPHWNSSMFNAANEGIDLTLYINPDSLAVGMTDMYGRTYPVQGHFRPSPIQREYEYVEPAITVDQYKWWQSSQTTGFTDKRRLFDMYGYKVKTYNRISSSSRSKLTFSYIPVAKTGNKFGVETFNTTGQ